jgi:hypothetical protein
MSKQVEFEIPGGLKAAQQEFEQWRSSHSGRRPIPESLWSLAATLAKEHGVFRTAQVLRLDYTKLKQQAHGAAPSKPSAAAVPAAFVELMAPASAQGCECVIEVEGPRGRMRIEWKGPVAPDLASLSRMLWEPGV